MGDKNFIFELTILSFKTVVLLNIFVELRHFSSRFFLSNIKLNKTVFI